MTDLSRAAHHSAPASPPAAGSRPSGAGSAGGAGALAAPLVATMIVLACTGFLTYQTGGETPRPADFADSSQTPRPFLAVLVTQVADCESAARSLALLNLPELRSRIRLGTLLLGDEKDAGRVAEVVRDHFGPVPVRVATRRNREALRAIGVRATPHLVILDRAGTVSFTSPPPPNAAAGERLRQTLVALTSTGRRREEQ